MQHGRRILWVELCADIPALIWNFDYLHKVGGWVDAHALHALLFVLLLIGIVELIAMAMALPYEELRVES